MNEELKTILNTEIKSLLPEIAKEQLDYILDNGRYIQKKEVDTGTLKYKVHEYVSPTGIGFTVIFTVIENEKEYVKTLEFGVGNGSSDWKELIEDLI